MTTAQPLMQVRAAARELGVHENTLRRWEEAGFIKAVRLPSGVRRFRTEDVLRIRDDMYGSADAAVAAAAASLGREGKTKSEAR
jgi:predicted site-specific integrase-resolvase